jgi:hypothetical protein
VLATRRPTVEAVAGDKNINTRRVSYLQQYKQDSLACMRVDVPRERSRCLEQARDSIRAAMKAQRGTLRSPVSDTVEE